MGQTMTVVWLALHLALGVAGLYVMWSGIRKPRRRERRSRLDRFLTVAGGVCAMSFGIIGVMQSLGIVS